MAYRQLCALTLVASWLAACGGGGTLPAASTNDSGDAAPANADQPPGSADQAPANQDQPPQASQSSGGPATPGAGNACEDFCEERGKDCGGNNQANTIVRGLCGRGCDTLLDGECAAAFNQLLPCVVALPGLCTEAGPALADLQKCTEVYQTWLTCDGDKGMDNPPAMQPAGCSKDTGCDCADTCASCRCALGENSASCDPICP